MSGHCPYLSAHETYPGHHILDHIRIHHPNPIRRQIESPLFYEGWACYAEQLLDELGYIRDPRQQLVGLKRRLWRCLRAILDVELHTGKIGLSGGAEKIVELGFSPQAARRQIRRFALTPGYQLCYFMGLYENSQDELTRPGDDWLSTLPYVWIGLQLLAAPGRAQRIVHGAVDNYSLPESASQAMLDLPDDTVEQLFKLSCRR